MKRLIAYFSYSNNTKNLVEGIKKEVKDVDVIRIERVKPYSSDYDECAYHEAKEEIDNNIHPTIKEIGIDLNSYDEIMIFFPVWWYTFPMPIATFVTKLHGYKGKVILFANSYTNDYHYMENSLRDFKKIDSKINVAEGLFNKDLEEHIKFIK